ncbi:hypothetical protein DITRI_Ditri04bG0106900 [Diplodiscus trichospermus]
MDLSSSFPESLQQLRNHDHQQYLDQSTLSYYYPQENQHLQQQYAYNCPPGYAHHHVPHHLNLQPAGVSVHAVPPMANSGWSMANVGLNPVAAAALVALSQLGQFQGTAMAGMQANLGTPLLFHWPTLLPPPPASGPPYSSGGRRGSRSFRGHGRGYNSRFLPRTGDPETGTAGARGGSQCFQPRGAFSASQEEPSNENVKSKEAAEPLSVLPKATAQTSGPAKASQSTPTVGKTPSCRRPPQGAWCELCRVECTGLEILEQHKNGKRHKKNLQKTEESKIAVKPGVEKQNAEKHPAKPENEGSQQPNSAQESEAKKLAESVGGENFMECKKQNAEKRPATPENEGYQQPNSAQENVAKKPAESVGGENFMECKQEVNGGKHTEGFVGGTPRIDCCDNQKRGRKRKMRGGQGGECMKTLEGPRLKVGPCKRKVVIPVICDLCNVKCDAQEVFDQHISGKKHTAKLKRYGPVGLQVLYPPDPIAQTLLLHQGSQQPVHCPQGSDPAADVSMPPQTHQAATVTSGSNLRNQ